LRLRAWEVALSALLAGLYAGLVIALGAISFLALQVRVADALLPLSLIFGRSAAIGLAIGCFIANFFGPFQFPFNLVDATLGSLANLIACLVGHKLGGLARSPPKAFAATLAITSIITAIVGTYLPFVLIACGFPADLPFLSASVAPAPLGLLLVGWVGIGLGSLVAVNAVGFPLLMAVKKALSRAFPLAEA